MKRLHLSGLLYTRGPAQQKRPAAPFCSTFAVPLQYLCSDFAVLCSPLTFPDQVFSSGPFCGTLIFQRFHPGPKNPARSMGTASAAVHVSELPEPSPWFPEHPLSSPRSPLFSTLPAPSEFCSTLAVTLQYPFTCFSRGCRDIIIVEKDKPFLPKPKAEKRSRGKHPGCVHLCSQSDASSSSFSPLLYPGLS